VFAHQRGVHAQLHLAPQVATDRQVLDHQIEAVGKAMVDGFDPPNASVGIRDGSTFTPKASMAKTTSLCAASWPSTSRVGSASAKPLACARRGPSRRGALLAHPRQDVVAGTVDDSEEVGDPVTGERLAQRPDDGNTAATKPSNARSIPFSIARATSSGPRVARSILLA